MTDDDDQRMKDAAEAMAIAIDPSSIYDDFIDFMRHSLEVGAQEHGPRHFMLHVYMGGFRAGYETLLGSEPAHDISGIIFAQLMFIAEQHARRVKNEDRPSNEDDWRRPGTYL